MNVVAPNPGAKNPNGPTQEQVLSVHHWTDHLFSFRTSRPKAFRFRSGEFIMLGLPKPDGKPLLRAYSMASPAWDEELEFFSIKVPDGPLTSRLQKITPGDHILLGRKPTGTLVLDALTSGERLFMFSTGTGIAPFASLIRDPETYERFGQVILTHTCRTRAELDYGFETVAQTRQDPLVGELAKDRLIHYTSLTREDHTATGRITSLMDSGKFYADLNADGLNPERDRVMICGSAAMLADVRARTEAAGLKEGSNAAPAQFVIEKSFVG